MSFFIKPTCCKPLANLFIEINSSVARFGHWPIISVALVLRCSRFSKIFNPIVMLNRIDMVNVFYWPLAINIKPCEPMSRYTFVKNPDIYITLCYGSSFFPNTNFIGNLGQPDKRTGLWVIFNHRLKFIKTKPIISSRITQWLHLPGACSCSCCILHAGAAHVFRQTVLRMRVILRVKLVRGDLVIDCLAKEQYLAERNASRDPVGDGLHRFTDRIRYFCSPIFFNDFFH